jgi:hypothetical protein
VITPVPLTAVGMHNVVNAAMRTRPSTGRSGVVEVPALVRTAALAPKEVAMARAQVGISLQVCDDIHNASVVQRSGRCSILQPRELLRRVLRRMQGSRASTEPLVAHEAFIDFAMKLIRISGVVDSLFAEGDYYEHQIRLSFSVRFGA